MVSRPWISIPLSESGWVPDTYNDFICKRRHPIFELDNLKDVLTRRWWVYTVSKILELPKWKLIIVIRVPQRWRSLIQWVFNMGEAAWTSSMPLRLVTLRVLSTLYLMPCLKRQIPKHQATWESIQTTWYFATARRLGVILFYRQWWYSSCRAHAYHTWWSQSVVSGAWGHCHCFIAQS